MTSLSPAATNMPCLAYCCHVQKGRTTHLEIPPNPEFSVRPHCTCYSLHKVLLGTSQQSLQGIPAGPGGAGLPRRHGFHLSDRLLATEEEENRQRACASVRMVQAGRLGSLHGEGWDRSD